MCIFYHGLLIFPDSLQTWWCKLTHVKTGGMDCKADGRCFAFIILFNADTTLTQSSCWYCNLKMRKQAQRGYVTGPRPQSSLVVELRYVLRSNSSAELSSAIGNCSPMTSHPIFSGLLLYTSSVPERNVRYFT